MDKAKTAILTGGLGALVPILLNLAVLDFEAVFSNLTTLAICGYLARVLVLFSIGAIVGWLYQSETDLKKVFQLGIAAPAVLTSLMNAKNVPTANQQAAAQIGGAQTQHVSAPADTQTSNQQSSLWLFPRSAQAQVNAGAVDINKPEELNARPESSAQQFLRGLTGQSESNWFVMVGSFTKIDNAVALANKLRHDPHAKDYDVHLYNPPTGAKHYAVAIGAHLSVQDAHVLRNKAMQNGLPGDIYLWSPTH